ncbi:DVU0524 family FlgM-associated protein [Desulfovibrio litoralis]|uniref:Uncharacterized protein n=1 Tax=Desulfovibrio litoralis DSM 11393 TaxID=1121455 RepID=A0A1M7T6D3_9BACT|nr:DVU0524 family FlgM-associated protein [Desulfovibrio litoralis]SHN66258.1 hypothetical protein SAMN02745728_01603 [Desulfovibrio litoralis DSM 11393]
MENKSFYIRNMLQHYDRQLINGRRIARYRNDLYGSEIKDDVKLKQEKRRQLVERVAKEIIENILMAGDENSIVKEVRETLEKEVGLRLTFKFPPLGYDIEVLQETPEGNTPLNFDAKHNLLDRLWRITLEKVNATML